MIRLGRAFEDVELKPSEKINFFNVNILKKRK